MFPVRRTLSRYTIFSRGSFVLQRGNFYNNISDSPHCHSGRNTNFKRLAHTTTAARRTRLSLYSLPQVILLGVNPR